jgi:hypothetical protein
MGVRKSVHLERNTRQVEARRKPDFSDNGDAEAGLRGRHQSGARRKPNAGRSRREGGFAGGASPIRIESPEVHRPLGVGSRKSEGRKAGAVCGGTSQRLIAGVLEKGTRVLETSARARRSSRRESAETDGQGMPEGRFTTKAQRRELMRRREAGQKAGRKEWQGTKGASLASSAGAGRRR